MKNNKTFNEMTVDEMFDECEKIAQLNAIKRFRDNLLQASKHCLFYGMLARGDVESVYKLTVAEISKGGNK